MRGECLKIRSGSAPGRGRQRQSGPALERLRWEWSGQRALGHARAKKGGAADPGGSGFPQAPPAPSKSASSNAPAPSARAEVDLSPAGRGPGDDDAARGPGGGPLCQGARVRLANLQSRPELNGITGTIVLFHEVQSRWQVRLDGTKSSKLFKGANLMRLDADQPPPQKDRSLEANLARLGAVRHQETGGSYGMPHPAAAEPPEGAPAAPGERARHSAPNGADVEGGAHSGTPDQEDGLRPSREEDVGGMAAAFRSIYSGSEWQLGADALSGLGSREETTRPFCRFLEAFLRGEGISSIVDVGCGHWPSGYQRFVDWGGASYVGVDIVPRVVEDNRAYLRRTSRLAALGLRSASFVEADARAPLPPADLLLVKDVLMHWPNEAVGAFVEGHLRSAAPKYRYVMLVQNETPLPGVRTMIDIEAGQLLPFDIRDPPFEAPVRNVFSWQSDEMKAVQLWEAPLPETPPR